MGTTLVLSLTATEQRTPSDDEPIPLKECTPPGTVMVTRPALELAKRFQAAIPAGWIVVFSWYDGGRVRASKDAPWVDTGAGLDLGTYPVGQIPEEAIYHDGFFRYAVLIRREVIESHPQRTIDLDGPRKVVLR